MLNYEMWPRYFIGFDRMLDNIPASNSNTGSGYPPYDIVKSGEDKYCIDMITLTMFTRELVGEHFKRSSALTTRLKSKGLILPMGYSIFN